MNEIYVAMRISQFLNSIKEVVKNNDVDILADIILVHSPDEAHLYETDKESDQKL